MRVISRLFCICFASLGLNACSHYALHSNVDPENIHEYFKASSVKVLSKQQLLQHDYQVITTLEGNNCQEKSNQPPATATRAKVDLLRKAADAKADAVVFSSCLTFPKDNVCYSSVSCYAKAVKILDH